MENKFSSTSHDGSSVSVNRWTTIRHPAVVELDEKQWRLGNFGVALYVISQAIPCFVLMNVRWMLAGSYVPKDMNHWFGGLLPTILLAVGIFFIWTGVQAVRSGRIAELQRLFTVSVVLGIAAIVTFIVPLRVHTWDMLSHFGSIYVVCLGAAAFYTAITTIVVLGVIFRARAGLVSPKTMFGPQSAAIVWTFNAIVWFALYVTFCLV